MKQSSKFQREIGNSPEESGKDYFQGKTLTQ